MKVARKSSRKRATTRRTTLTLSMEVCRKIDALRGDEGRSVWLQQLVEREAARQDRVHLAATLREQYTQAVCEETLALNDEFPVHEA